MGTNVAGTWDKAVKLLQECSTKQPGSEEARAALLTVRDLVDKASELPPPPKAVWKKLLQQLKVPLRLGAAFSAAAQHSWKSLLTHTALITLQSLIRTAKQAGLTKGAGSSSLASSMRQQLEQSGVLQQLAAVMTAAAADLQDEVAAHAAGVWRQSQALMRDHGLLQVIMSVYDLMMALWEPQSDVDKIAWLCHPSGHAAAGMQLTSAVLRHVSILAQHLLPDLQDMPQEAEELLGVLQTNTRTAQALGMHLLGRVVLAHARWQQQGQGSSDGQGLQQLLLSPERLHFAAVMVVLLAADVSGAVAAHSNQVGASSGSSSSTAAPTAQQRAPGGNSSSSGSSSSGGVFDTPSICQLQLLQLLGLAPEVTAWAQEPVNLPAVCAGLRMALDACKEWCAGVLDPSDCSGVPSWQLQLQQQQQLQQLQQQQRHQVQEQLLLLPNISMLLPAVLLLCASRLLSPSAQQLLRQRSQQLQATVQQLLDLSSTVLIVGDDISRQQESLGWLPPAPPAGWVQELLGVVLQLVDHTVHQQTPTQAGSTGGSSSSNDSGLASTAAARAGYLARLLPLFSTMLFFSQGELCQPSNSASSSGTNSSSSGLKHAAAAASPEAASSARLGPVLEAALRAVTTAMQSGAITADDLPLESSALFTELLVCRQGYTHSTLVQHMGLCGPEVLAQEQRQLYSLLSTVLKMGRPCWGVRAPSGCCTAAGEAAVGLLLQATAASAPAAQQPAVDYLPSLVIFGRCCLQWTEQLQQQASGLLLHASAWLEQQGQQRREAGLHAHSAALVCIRGLQSGAVTVSKWVGGVEAPAALAQLEAAGCAPQQLQQQLQTLMLAMQETQQGATDASLTALVQQLQTTGAMLCNIAVPHFCNNPGCANISGLTEVQLVSGRSCICAGCHIARYCGRDCQRAAWKVHKPVCKALAGASVAAATAETSAVQ